MRYYTAEGNNGQRTKKMMFPELQYALQAVGFLHREGFNHVDVNSYLMRDGQKVSYKMHASYDAKYMH